MFLDSLVGKNINKTMQYAKMMNGYAPIFSQFGENIYASDVVQNCIDRIATEVSKLQPKHIRTDSNGMKLQPNTSINRLFKFAPNDLMSTRDFLEKVTWKLLTDYNSFIYPMYDIYKDTRGNKTRNYTAFYPLNPTMVDFLQDDTNKLFVKFYFRNGDNYTLPYSDVIHLRKKYSINDVMGGGYNGQPDNEALLKVLEINNTVLEGVGNAVKTSLAIRGVFKMNTVFADTEQKKEITKFEKALAENTSGILPMDLKGEYIPITADPKIVDKDTLDFLQNKILHWYGVSLPILTGDFTDNQYESFYSTTIEPLIISMGQAFSRAIFTDNELNFGNEIVFYTKDLAYLSTTTKLNLLKTVGEQGLLSDDEKLAILGYPPISDGSGSRRTMSLNYIDTKIIDDYQLARAKVESTLKDNNNGGDNSEL